MITIDARDQKLFECCIKGCPAITRDGRDPDPRKRWALNIRFTGDDGQVIECNFCPQHVKECLKADEDFFARTERAEQFVRENVQNAE